MMDLSGDDLDAAYFLVHRHVDSLRAAGRPVNASIESFYRKVNLLWAISDEGNEFCGGAEESEQVIGTVEASRILGVTPRHVGNLAKDLDGWQVGRTWSFKWKTVMAYAEARRDGRLRPTG